MRELRQNFVPLLIVLSNVLLVNKDIILNLQPKNVLCSLNRSFKTAWYTNSSLLSNGNTGAQSVTIFLEDKMTRHVLPSIFSTVLKMTPHLILILVEDARLERN